ncbi:MAG: hypothetical protein RSC57_02170, partial [Bacilli bacterium]
INFEYFKENGGYFDIFIILIPILGFLFLLFHEVNFFSKGLKAEIEKNNLVINGNYTKYNKTK